jgi:hypothetical protein
MREATHTGYPILALEFFPVPHICAAAPLTEV